MDTEQLKRITQLLNLNPDMSDRQQEALLRAYMTKAQQFKRVGGQPAIFEPGDEPYLNIFNPGTSEESQLGNAVGPKQEAKTIMPPEQVMQQLYGAQAPTGQYKPKSKTIMAPEQLLQLLYQQR